MRLTDIRIKLCESQNQNNRLKAFCALTFDNTFVIRDVKIIEGNDGLFLAMPSRKLCDRCRRCGEKNHLRARFCNNCATALSPAPATRKERKFATALFADLVGSTALAEREDPEVVQSVVGRTFDRLSEEIGRYEGLLEKFMGDAVLAVFGVPRAH